MTEFDSRKTLNLLQSIMEYEFAGVIRYTYYSLVVTDSNQTDIVNFLKEQAEESLTHAQRIGEILVSLKGNPKPRSTNLEEIEKSSVKDILIASQNHEQTAIEIYKQLLSSVRESNPELINCISDMIEEEGSHYFELEQMIKDLE
ncbi:MAG: bacterioferritin [Methylacidiphilales bacterium]|nr:bacterioferritin [Candidatus Methylacidiphilales bacterium]NJR15489.1 bacterioferritin [Calothrix sp. CSU_2_0]